MFWEASLAYLPLWGNLCCPGGVAALLGWEASAESRRDPVGANTVSTAAGAQEEQLL